MSTPDEPVVALNPAPSRRDSRRSDRQSRAGRSRRIRRRLASYAVIVGGLLAIGSAYGFATAGPGVAAAGNPNESILLGKALYLQGCSSCHGLAAEGGTDAPSLIGVGAAAVDFQVSTGRMPLQQQEAEARRKAPRYDPAQTAQLAAYIASLGPGPSVPAKDQYTPTDADMAIGGNLFRTNCSSCHNFTGEGGALAYGKSAPSLRHSTDQQIYEAMLTGPGTMPVFGDRQLTEDQKKDIIAYVQGMKATPDPGGFSLGRAGAVAEGLVAWLAGVGLLAGVAMWIGARARRAT
jgi:ubiquinol-cytochrome c reductase cytochrome c subunit